MIEHTLSDDSDINRELKCLFVRANILNRRFWRCSVEVKLRLVKTFCMCFYDIGLWRYYRVGSLQKLASAYVKCIKIFFGYHQYSSVFHMLLDLGLPSFNTVIFNANALCVNRLKSSVNSLVQSVFMV